MPLPPPKSVVRAMQCALDRLPDPDREVFVRVRFEDQDYRRIALDLRLPVAEVERCVARALLALHVAARRAERRSWHSRSGRICAWLRQRLPQGWRR